MIQAIVYDAVGTLIHVQPSVGAIYADIGRRFGSTLPAQVIEARFRAAFERQEQIDRAAGWRTDEARERRRWRDIVAHVLDDVADAPGCFAALYDIFGTAKPWALDADAPAVLATLQGRGLRQAVASNFDARLHAVLDALPIRPFLEQVVISSEVGWRKPASAFFARLSEALRLPTDAILYVGDDRGNDFAPARDAGMKSALLDPHRRHLDVSVERLERLTDLLDRVETQGS